MERLYAAHLRPVRFLATGAAAGIVQLALLAALTRRGVDGLPANAVAFVLAAQVNFALSAAFTWRDRLAPGGLRRLIARWAAFHASVAGTALLNQGVFLVARRGLPDLAAAALGIGVASLGNHLLGNRVVFKPAPLQVSREEPAASKGTPR